MLHCDALTGVLLSSLIGWWTANKEVEGRERGGTGGRLGEKDAGKEVGGGKHLPPASPAPVHLQASDEAPAPCIVHPLPALMTRFLSFPYCTCRPWRRPPLPATYIPSLQ